MVNYFHLYNISSSQTIAILQLSQEVTLSILNPDNNHLNKEMVFHNIPYGKDFTIVPINDPTISILMRLKNIHKICTTQPSIVFSMAQQKFDELLYAVNDLFGKTSYYCIYNIEDIEKLINPKKYNDEKPTLYKKIIIDEIINKLSDLSTVGVVNDDKTTIEEN